MQGNTPQGSQGAAGCGLMPRKRPKGLRGAGSYPARVPGGCGVVGLGCEVLGLGFGLLGLGFKFLVLGFKALGLAVRDCGVGTRSAGAGVPGSGAGDGWGSRFRMRMMQGSGSQLRGFRTGLRGFGPKSSKPEPPTFAGGQPQTPRTPQRGRHKENPGYAA